MPQRQRDKLTTAQLEHQHLPSSLWPARLPHTDLGALDEARTAAVKRSVMRRPSSLSWADTREGADPSGKREGVQGWVGWAEQWTVPSCLCTASRFPCTQPFKQGNRYTHLRCRSLCSWWW